MITYITRTKIVATVKPGNRGGYIIDKPGKVFIVKDSNNMQLDKNKLYEFEIVIEKEKYALVKLIGEHVHTWSINDDSTHKCSTCGLEQSHNWTKTNVEPLPNEPRHKITYMCKDCGATDTYTDWHSFETHTNVNDDTVTVTKSCKTCGYSPNSYSFPTPQYIYKEMLKHKTAEEIDTLVNKFKEAYAIKDIHQYDQKYQCYNKFNPIYKYISMIYCKDKNIKIDIPENIPITAACGYPLIMNDKEPPLKFIIGEDNIELLTFINTEKELLVFKDNQDNQDNNIIFKRIVQASPRCIIYLDDYIKDMAKHDAAYKFIYKLMTDKKYRYQYTGSTFYVKISPDSCENEESNTRYVLIQIKSKYDIESSSFGQGRISKSLHTVYTINEVKMINIPTDEALEVFMQQSNKSCTKEDLLNIIKTATTKKSYKELIDTFKDMFSHIDTDLQLKRNILKDPNKAFGFDIMSLYKKTSSTSYYDNLAKQYFGDEYYDEWDYERTQANFVPWLQLVIGVAKNNKILESVLKILKSKYYNNKLIGDFVMDYKRIAKEVLREEKNGGEQFNKNRAAMIFTELIFWGLNNSMEEFIRDMESDGYTMPSIDKIEKVRDYLINVHAKKHELNYMAPETVEAIYNIINGKDVVEGNNID